MIERDFLISKKTDKGLSRGERYKLALVSLGCDKNRVDSEIMLGMLKNKYQMTEDPMEADIIIVNTCGFIEAAKEESINTILEMARFKEEGQCKLLMATGCLTQRYGEDLMREMPELDVILGVNSYAKLDEYVEKFIVDRKRIIDTAWSDVGVNDGRRLLTTNFGMTAYVRIGEGCDNNCTYCIIPKIRGKYRSRDRESIMTEIRLLADSGVREIIVIAQDITEYGRDIEGRQVLHELLEEIDKVEGLKWIRLLYMYPEGIYDDLLATIARSEKILPYFDMPIQQISDSVLRRMGRRTNRQAIEDVIAKIRSLMPESILRTSLITGFPGETEEEFEELKTWLTEIKLDYSKEEGTPAWHMKDQVAEEIKLERRDELMLAQQAVSLAKNEAKLGSVYEVLVEGKIEDYYTGRSYEMAPEIDGEILIETNKELIAGNWIKVKIKEALEYDLIGEVYHESSK